jgi:dihydrofolate reductase
MRNVILSVGVSLDGYIARPDGAVDFLIMPKDVAKSMDDFFSTIDTLVMGRKTLGEGLKIGGFSRWSMPVYVFSRLEPPGERDGIVYINESPASFIRQLRQCPGKDIWLMGGGELARDFLKADLIDELHLGVVPVLLGEGIPLFPSGFPQLDFTLVENSTYSEGLIGLKYKRTRSKVNRKS